VFAEGGTSCSTGKKCAGEKQRNPGAKGIWEKFAAGIGNSCRKGRFMAEKRLPKNKTVLRFFRATPSRNLREEELARGLAGGHAELIE